MYIYVYIYICIWIYTYIYRERHIYTWVYVYKYIHLLHTSIHSIPILKMALLSPTMMVPHVRMGVGGYTTLSIEIHSGPVKVLNVGSVSFGSASLPDQAHAIQR